MAVETRRPIAITPSTAPIKYSEGQPGPGASGESVGGAKERAVVVIESVTLVGAVPGVIVAEGENVAVAPIGRGDSVNVTGLENVPEGETVRLKLAGWPAVTEVGVVGALTE